MSLRNDSIVAKLLVFDRQQHASLFPLIKLSVIAKQRMRVYKVALIIYLH